MKKRYYVSKKLDCVYGENEAQSEIDLSTKLDKSVLKNCKKIGENNSFVIWEEK